MPCSNCFEIDLKQCPSTIEVTGGLTANTDYYWVITRNNRIYQKKVTTDDTGKLVIDCATDLPAGLLNAYAGAFILDIRLGSNYLNIITLTGGYTCIVMRFVDVEGDAGINNLVNVVAA